MTCTKKTRSARAGDAVMYEHSPAQQDFLSSFEKKMEQREVW